MNTKATLGLTAGALAIGLLAGVALGHGGEKTEESTGPGPTKTVAGVPVGYKQSRAGAVAAAAAYTRALNETTSSPPEDRRAVLNEISSTAAKNEIQARADEAYTIVDKAAPKDGTLFVHSGTLAFRIDSYDGSQANIVLWSVDVIGSATTDAQSGWGTKTVLLRWDRNDWKLAAFPGAMEGPTPTTQGQPTGLDGFVSAIKGLEPLGHATTD